jgi:alkaline phosphatase D
MREGFPNIVEAGRNALFDYSPIDRNPEEPNRIYRSFNWGRDLDLFILDARSYRSRNNLEDIAQNNKTLLGAEQLAWLKQELQSSSATWKVISSDVPLSIPTGGNAAVFGRDAWANGTDSDFSSDTGFERELGDLVEFLDEIDIKNLVFVTTDVHWATNIGYSTDADGDGDMLEFHEFVSGPINAVQGTPGPLDPSLDPTTLYAEGGIFNVGEAAIVYVDGDPHFRVQVRDETGEVRPGSEVDLTPQ